MLGWSTIAPVLIEVFTELGADPDLPDDRFSAEWKNGRVAAIGTGQRFSLQLQITNVIAIGQDETRYELDEGTNKLSLTQTGQRKFTLQVLVVCVDRTDDVWAMAPLERIRTRIRRPRILQRLLDVDVALIDIKPAIKAPFRDGGRWMQAASMDIVFGTVVNDTDTIQTGWIERITYDSHALDVDGTELPAPPNVVDHEVPPA